MAIGEVIKNSFREYRENFKSSFVLVFLFYALPFLITSLVGYGFGGYSFYSNGGAALSGAGFWVWELLSLVSLFVTLLCYFSLVGGSMQGDGFSVQDALNRGKSVYLKGVGVALWIAAVFAIPILITSLVLMFSQASWVMYILILLIPSVIVVTYWSLGFYSLMESGDGVIGALQGSAQMVRGNWWRTFGYGLVFGIFAYLIILVFRYVLIKLIALLSYLFASSVNTFLISGIAFTLIVDIITMAIIIPLAVFFFKNYYEALK